MTRAYLFTALLVAVVLAGLALMQARAGAPEMKLPDLGGWQWPEECCEMVSYTVGQGDSLWAIARRYFPEARTEAVVWAIREANDLQGPQGPVIRPGDTILIPDPLKYGFKQGR